MPALGESFCTEKPEAMFHHLGTASDDVCKQRERHDRVCIHLCILYLAASAPMMETGFC